MIACCKILVGRAAARPEILSSALTHSAIMQPPGPELPPQQQPQVRAAHCPSSPVNGPPSACSCKACAESRLSLCCAPGECRTCAQARRSAVSPPAVQKANVTNPSVLAFRRCSSRSSRRRCAVGPPALLQLSAIIIDSTITRVCRLSVGGFHVSVTAWSSTGRVFTDELTCIQG